jgi:uncharacterized alkaline shock family protein YloU
MDEQRARQGGQQESPLQSERGATTIGDAVVAKIFGIAAQEVEGVQMGGGTARAMGGFLDSVPRPRPMSGVGGGSQTRGVSVEIGAEEAAADLSMAVDYGRQIPQTTEAVRNNVINRVENLTGLRVTEVNITVNDVLFPEEGRPQQEQQQQVR